MSAIKPLQYWVQLGATSFLVRELRGEEHISAPFRFECRFIIPTGKELDPDEVVGTEASVILDRGGTVRTIHGLVSDVWLRASASGVPEAVLIIEPRFAMMRHRQDVRLFREKTAVDIVREVLAAHGIKPEERLADTYVVRHYTVQLRETDFDFVTRLLEDEGIFYCFHDDGTLVLGDRTSSYDVIPGDPVLPYRPGLGLDGNQDCVTEVGAVAKLLAGKLSLRDFNAEHPNLDMDVGAKGPTPSGPEWYDFPGEYALPPQGSTKVQKRADALTCESLVHTGKSFSGRLVPGSTFDLALAPPGVDDGSYVVTRVLHDYNAVQSGYSIGFEALPASVLFRPLVLTEAPTLTDPLTGIVTGPAGEDIYCDSYGRVKVHFPWDRLFPYDDTCSYWIPVLQDNTGHSNSIPRIGWEVLVHFLEGDPDRPVVVGRVYNPEDPPHLYLPVEKTRSVIKSLTSPRDKKRDDSGTNELMLEDLQGNEFIQYHSQKDQLQTIAHDKTETVLLSQASTVERDEKVKVGKDHKAKIGRHLMSTVSRDQTHKVGGNRKVSVDAADTCTVKGERSLTIGARHSRRIGADDTAMAQEDNTERVDGMVFESSLKDNTNTGTQETFLTVGGMHVEIAKNDKNEGVGVSRSETIKGMVWVKADGQIGLRTNKMRQSNITGPLRIKSAKAMTLTGVQKLLSESLTHKITGPDGIHLKVGNTQVILKDGSLAVSAEADIKLTISGTNDQGSGKGTQQ